MPLVHIYSDALNVFSSSHTEFTRFYLTILFATSALPILPKMCFCISIKLTLQFAKDTIQKNSHQLTTFFRLLEMKSVLTALIFGTVHAQECSIPSELPEGMVLTEYLPASTVLVLPNF